MYESPETPPPYPHASERPVVPTPPTAHSFGGAPVYSPPGSPPGKSRKGALIFLILTSIILFICFSVVYVGGKIYHALDLEGINLPLPSSDKTIALLRIEGIITDSASTLAVIKRYQEADNIKGVLVRVDSGGGAVGACEEIYRGIEELKKSGKKVVVSMGNAAASGGYYVSCGAERVYANAGTLTGSIGVIMSLPNVEKLSEKIGVNTTTITSGKYKNVPTYMNAPTEEERAFLQTVIDDTYDGFAGIIFQHRSAQLGLAMEELRAAAAVAAADDPKSLSALGPNVVAADGASVEEYLRQIADGRIMTGRQAFKLGLVDEIGGQAEAVRYLAKKIGIKDPELYEYTPKRKLTVLDILLGGRARSAIQNVTVSLSGPRLEYRMP